MTAIYVVMVEPSLASQVDLSPFTDLFTGISNQLSGPVGKAGATLALIATFLVWFFGIINWMTLVFLSVAIVAIPASASIVSSLWGT